MIILAHRGCWNSVIEKNSLKALRAALEQGYGFESDVRDYKEQLVISHNIASENSENAEEVFKWMEEFKNQYCFAINVKADGLKDILKKYIDAYHITNYFLFDMSVPQMVEFQKAGLRFFSRQSEIEPEPCMYEDAAGVWIDGFCSTEWITEELLQRHLAKGKKVCLVSPELHGVKNYKEFWSILKGYKLDMHNLMLCTDYPNEAKEHFNG